VKSVHDTCSIWLTRFVVWLTVTVLAFGNGLWVAGSVHVQAAHRDRPGGYGRRGTGGPRRPGCGLCLGGGGEAEHRDHGRCRREDVGAHLCAFRLPNRRPVPARAGQPDDIAARNVTQYGHGNPPGAAGTRSWL
jgi:hypothetical protein